MFVALRTGVSENELKQIVKN